MWNHNNFNFSGQKYLPKWGIPIKYRKQDDTKTNDKRQMNHSDCQMKYSGPVTILTTHEIEIIIKIEKNEIKVSFTILPHKIITNPL